jgi:hypothetical protein
MRKCGAPPKSLCEVWRVPRRDGLPVRWDDEPYEPTDFCAVLLLEEEKKEGKRTVSSARDMGRQAQTMARLSSIMVQMEESRSSAVTRKRQRHGLKQHQAMAISYQLAGARLTCSIRASRGEVEGLKAEYACDGDTVDNRVVSIRSEPSP